MPWWLLAGAALGLAAAAVGLLESPARSDRTTGLGEEIAAVVGERTIRRVDYERMLAGVEQDLRNPIDDATRRRVLERMIDEELLVQQAIGLGLAASDRRVRGELVASLVDSVVAETEGEPASADEVERHYRENLAFFARPSRLRIESLFFSAARGGADGARERARQAREALAAGQPGAEVERALADPQVAKVPDALLPLAKLRDYVGPAVLEVASALPPGAWSEPIASLEGERIVRVVEREAGEAPAFESVAAIVGRDLERRRGDDALRRYLEGLREQIPVERNEAIFAR